MPKVTQLARGRTGVCNQVSKTKVKGRPWVGERAGPEAAKQGRGRRGRGWEGKPGAAGSWEV